MEKEK
jgi:hypothetical protein